ncbi:hypothetical protein NC652_014632 [Populus alba x Populus x berolinensis]|nr:hypothetical protein NC652_014632 [Populus alba x Populus x berolinensis]
MRFLYHLRCQAHHAIRRRTALEPAVYTNSMVHLKKRLQMRAADIALAACRRFAVSCSGHTQQFLVTAIKLLR